ncbi:MAG: 3-isopropylmalate dehydrogenase [Planctomycetaceae bacterium]|nr:3-isopropylmalate dehydrogenase [Planctomycetaceae bacterium]
MVKRNIKANSRESNDQLTHSLPSSAHRWSQLITDPKRQFDKPDSKYQFGVFPGEGIGPEIIDASLQVLRRVGELRSINFEPVIGGPIGLPAVAESGQCLPDDAIEFCKTMFATRSPILAGAGGSRFVYDMRREFDLFCKINPLTPNPILANCGVLKSAVVKDVDIIVVRDNSAGIYQGTWTESTSPHGLQATQTFSYNESQIQKIVRVSAAIAQNRRQKLSIVIKSNGVPTISNLWVQCAKPIAKEFGVALEFLDIDFAVYQVVQSPTSFDVIVTPNLCGDIIADVGGLLLGSRGLCFGASFSTTGAGVYQTNHGAAHDLAGTNRANPVGQIYSLAMMLHEQFGLTTEAKIIDTAISEVWKNGFRTFDTMEPNCQLVGTQEMTELIVKSIQTGDT